jgi:hypothetical protein
MSDNLSVAVANATLSVFAADALYMQLHTGDPGASGTSNVSSTTTREAVTWGAPSGGVLTASNSPAWPSWAGTNGEVVTDVSYWSTVTGGTFAGSATLATSATMATSDTLTLTPVTFTLPTAS